MVGVRGDSEVVGGEGGELGAGGAGGAALGRDVVCSSSALGGFSLSVLDCGELLAATAETLGLPEQELINSLALAASQADVEKSPFRLLLQIREDLQLDEPGQWRLGDVEEEAEAAEEEEEGEGEGGAQSEDMLQELDQVLQASLPGDTAAAGSSPSAGHSAVAASGPEVGSFRWFIAEFKAQVRSDLEPVLQVLGVLFPKPVRAVAAEAGRKLRRGASKVGKSLLDSLFAHSQEKLQQGASLATSQMRRVVDHVRSRLDQTLERRATTRDAAPSSSAGEHYNSPLEEQTGTEEKEGDDDDERSVNEEDDEDEEGEWVSVARP
uniref:Uncharacterized protein n=1 Tax=Rhizochromulina marina TaxID=1034831 RepID=A0A7S2SWZ0_9STRA